MEPVRESVLLVEDDEATRTFLADNLAADGFQVATASAPGEAVRAVELRRPDLVLLDLLLEGGNGLTVLDRVRSADGLGSRIDPDVPVIVLSARAAEVDRVRGFARGCDDYVVKPFSYPELVARVRAMLRRSQRRPGSGRIRVGPLEIDPLGRRVWLGDVPLSLSKKEFALLRALAGEPTRVFTREELLRGVWNFRAMGHTRTLDSHAFRLRQKLNRAGDRFVVNVWGVGYRLVDGGLEQ